MEQTFWITNISNRNVSLSDLNISVPAMSSVNLLDKKHYYLTEEQVKKSAAKGSIFAKRDKIVVRRVAPITLKGQKPIPFNQDIPSPRRSKSVYEIKQEQYEELKVDQIPETDESKTTRG
jgi:hypothetical protein